MPAKSRLTLLALVLVVACTPPQEQSPECGDGVVQAPEECDDANQSNTDSCLSTCQSATCGDGFLEGGVEECDDGDQSNDDACLSTCVAAFCSDGVVQRGVEECDDRNRIDGDGC